MTKKPPTHTTLPIFFFLFVCFFCGLFEINVHFVGGESEREEEDKEENEGEGRG